MYGVILICFKELHVFLICFQSSKMSQLRKISGLLASFVSPTKGDFKRYKDLTEKYIFSLCRAVFRIRLVSLWIWIQKVK